MAKVQIASAIASAHGITLYLGDGGVRNLPNDDWRTKEILDKVLGPLARGEQVFIDLDDYSIEKKVEKKSNGLIRFFKRTVSAVATAFGGSQSAPLDDAFEILPSQDVTTTAPVKKLAGNLDANLNAPGDLVAVVKDKAGNDVVVPGVEKLRKQIDWAARTGNTVGLQRFLERIATVEHEHTVDELLTFMEKGDLPIADDGCIVAYKVLTTSSYKLGNVTLQKGEFVDCHSGQVRQKVGSQVQMKRELVDPSRRLECSAGLHVARRQYLKGFSGNIITIIKVAPEDVVCVPRGEPDKMRVRAYHVVAEVPASAHAALRANSPMTDKNHTAAKMLADVLRGNHIGVTEIVEIGGPYGTNLTITPVDGAAPAPKKFQSGKEKALEEAKPIEALAPKAIRKQAVKEKAKIEGESAKDRRNRVKREKRAAEREAREKAMGAITAPAAPPAKKMTMTKVQKAEKIVASDGRVLKDRNGPVDDKTAQQARALHLVAGGMSIRAAERETGVSARTIGRLLKNK